MKRINIKDIEEIDYTTYYKGEPFTGICFHANIDGSLKSETTFEDGIQNGPYKEWYENGQLESEYEHVSLKTGVIVRDGLHKEWYENGNQRSVFYFKNGQKNGPYHAFYENGNPYGQVEKVNGLSHGLAVFYDFNGLKKRTAVYSSGVCDGLLCTFHSNGVKASEIMIKQNKRDGLFKEWNEKGDLINEEIVQDETSSTLMYFEVINFDGPEPAGPEPAGQIDWIKISSNKELRDLLGKYNLSDEHKFDDFEVEVNPYCMYDRYKFEGEFEGHKYVFYVGNTADIGAVEEGGFDYNIERFLNAIDKKELGEIDFGEIGFKLADFSEIDERFPLEIEWLGDVPAEIKELAQKDNYKTLIEHSFENFYDEHIDMPFFDDREIIQNIHMTFRCEDEEIKISWSVTD